MITTRYSLPALEDALAGTIFAGKLRFSPTTGSTNADALEAARIGAPHGSVYFADEQIAGRGRGGHRWQSAAGEGLYVSVLLRPVLPAVQLALIPLLAGLAAAEAIRASCGLTVDLRWPNDLLFSRPQSNPPQHGLRYIECKMGGILVESKTEGDRVAYAVVGIGINVHQRIFEPGLATPATSLDLEANHPVDRQSLLVALLKSLEHETLGLHDAASAATIPKRIERASTWVRGRRVEVHGPQACVGITVGLDEHGFLRVCTADGLVTVQTGGIRAAETD